MALFLLSSTTQEFRKLHSQKLLERYHATLTNVLTSNGIDPNFYGLADVLDDYKDGLITGITFCIFGFPGILLEEGDEVADIGGIDLTDSAAIEKRPAEEEKAGRLRSEIENLESTKRQLDALVSERRETDANLESRLGELRKETETLHEAEARMRELAANIAESETRFSEP